MTHFVLVLYAGNYLDASRRRAAGLPDRYRHHSYAVAALERVRATGARVSVIQVRGDAVYDEQPAGGVRYLGLGARNAADAKDRVVDYLLKESATHVMVRFPSPVLLRAVASRPVRISVVLADSFPSRLRRYRSYRALSRLLAHRNVDFVANHQLNSARQLVDVLGADPGKVIAWDWPLDLVQTARTSARVRSIDERLRLCYVGTINRSKGVWDAVEALAILREQGLDATLELAGSGDLNGLEEAVQRRGLEVHVRYLGRVGGDDIVALMQRSDFVLVPSRHTYPEGLPLTIYEAMASGTPLVASDHPMFRGVVRDGETGFVFRAGRPSQLAAAVLRGWGDNTAYTHVSAAAAAAYPRLGLPTLWGDLLLRWARDTPEDRAWLRDVSLQTASSA